MLKTEVLRPNGLTDLKQPLLFLLLKLLFFFEFKVDVLDLT